MHTYMVLFSEGGIVQWEEIFNDELSALERSEEHLGADEENETYVYRFSLDGTIARMQGTIASASWFDVRTDALLA